MMQATGGGGGGLPDEYQQVEYLEKTAQTSGYFDGGEILSNGVLYIKGSMYFGGGSSFRNYIALVQDMNFSRFMLVQNAYYVGNISGTQFYHYNMPLPNGYIGDVDFELFADNGYSRFDANGALGYMETYNSQSPLPAKLVLLQNTSGKIRTLSFYNSSSMTESSMIYKYVPCYRKSDNIKGLYELVNGIFYYSNDQNQYQVGPDVN